MSGKLNNLSSQIFNVLTAVFFRSGDLARALDCNQLAIHAAKWSLSDRHPLLLECYRTLGRLFGDDGKWKQALDSMLDCVSLATRVLGNNHPRAAMYYVDLGHVYQAVGELDRAVSNYEKAIVNFETVLGPSDLRAAMARYHLAEALLKKGAFDGAAREARASLDVRRAQLPANHGDVRDSLHLLANAHEKLGDAHSAIACLKEILLLLKEVRVRVRALAAARAHGAVLTAYVRACVCELAQSEDESALPEIQQVTREIIRLKFTLLPPERHLILAKIRTQNRHFNDSALLSDVIAELFDGDPEAIVETLFQRVASMDGDAYVRLACIMQLAEDDEVMLRYVVCAAARGDVRAC